jgi:anti-sigma B factor antagonist
VSLEIEQREKEGVIILDLKGHIRFGEEDLQLRQYVDALKKAGKTKVIFDLKNVSEMDDTGCQTLVLLSQELRKEGGRAAVLSPSKTHAEMFVCLKLESSLEVCDDEKDAVDSFFPDREVKHYDILSFLQEKGLVKPSEEKISE